MKKMKKLLAILVAVVLAFSCFAAIPMTASAAGVSYMAKLNYTTANSWTYLQTEMNLAAGTYQFDVDYVTEGSVKAKADFPGATVVDTTDANGHISIQLTWGGSGNFQAQLRDDKFSGTGIVYFANPVLKKLENGSVTGNNLVYDFAKQFTDVGSTVTTKYGWGGKWYRSNTSAAATFTVEADANGKFDEKLYMAKLNYTTSNSWTYLQTEMNLPAGTYQFDVDYRAEGDVTPKANFDGATINSYTNKNGHISIQLTWGGSGNFQAQLRDDKFSGTGIVYFANPVLKKLENGLLTGNNLVYDFAKQFTDVGSTVTTDYGWGGKWYRSNTSAAATFTVEADANGWFTNGLYFAKLNYTGANSWTYMQTEMSLAEGTYQFEVDYVTDGSVKAKANFPGATVVDTTDANGHITVQFTWPGSSAGNFQAQLCDDTFGGKGIVYFANPVLKKLENGSVNGKNLVFDFAKQYAVCGSTVTTDYGWGGKWYRSNGSADATFTVEQDFNDLFTDKLYLAKLNYTTSNSWTYLQTEMSLAAGTYQFDVDYRAEGDVTPKANFDGATINSYTNKNGHISVQLTWGGSGNFQAQLRDDNFSGTGIVYFANPVLKKLENGSVNGKNLVYDFAKQHALLGSTVTTDYGWGGKWYRSNESTSATFTVEADANGKFDEPIVDIVPLYEAVDADGYSLSGDEGFQTFTEALKAVTDGGAIISLDSNVLKGVTLSKDISYTIYGSFEDAGTIAFEEGVTVNKGNVTFENVTCDGVILIDNGATLNINGGNYTNSNSHMIQIEEGDLTIDGDASFEYTNKWASLLRVLNNGHANITINSGTFKGESHNTLFFYTENTTGTFTINGGTFIDTTPSSETAGGAIIRTVCANKDGRAASAANVVINGGTFNLSRPAPAILHEGTGTLSINNATSTNTYGPVLKVDGNCDVAIKNSTFTSSGGSQDTVILNGSGKTSFEKSIITSPAGKNAVYFDTNNMPEVIGLENSFNGLNYLGDLAPVCRIGEKQYSSFADAIAAVNDGETIILLSNLDSKVDFNVNKTYTIDANGYAFDTNVKVSAGTVTLLNVTQELAAGNNEDNITVSNGNLIIDGGSYKHARNGGVLVILTGSGNVTITGDAVLDKSSNSSGHCITASETATGTIKIDNATVKNAEWARIFEASGEQSIVITKNAKIVPHSSYGSALMKITGGSVSITGQNIKIGNNTILAAAGAEVILSGCTLTSDGAVLGLSESSVVRVTSASTIQSKKSTAFKDNIKGTIIGGELLTVIDAADPTDGLPRILRLAGDKNGSWGGYAQYVKLDANSTYTYSFDYRATGGIKLWNSLSLENITKSNEVLTGTHYTVTLTTANSPSCTIILGEKSDSTGGTLYLSNISVVKEGSSTNIVKNGDFATNDLSNWNPQNNPEACFESIELIKPHASVDFFDDASIEAVSNNYAVALKGGSWKVFKFTAYLEANASYTFSYDYRAVGDILKFYLSSGVTITEITDGEDKFTKTYTITNGDTAQKVEFKFGTEEDTTGNIMYLSNFKLYKLDNGVVTGANMVADINPVYPVYYSKLQNEGDEIAFNPDVAFANKVGFGWQGNSLSGLTSIVKIPENFFVKYGDAALLVMLTRALLNRETVSINPYYDANIDGNFNILDLIRTKKVTVGAFGADHEADLLKAEIMGAGNTDISAITGKVVYVDSNAASGGNGTEASPYNSISTANNNVSSGGAVLLKRGSTFRGNYSFKSGVTYGSYGEGAKPEIIGSTKDWKTANWTNVGGNIWSVNYGSSTRPGNIYLFKGEDITTPAVIGRVIDNTADSYFDSNEDLVKEGDMRFANKTVYLYSESDPSTAYSRIEISSGETAITLDDNVTVNNIAVKYAGEHGISTSKNNNVTISYCEIAYIGGTELEGAPLGNGIQFGLGGSNLVADHNYIYECYDAGVTPQIWDSLSAGNFNGVTISNNLLTNNFYNLELWAENGSAMKDISVTGNVLKDAGYCWSWDQRFETLGNGAFLSSNIYGSKDRLNTTAGNSISIADNTFGDVRALQVAWYWNNDSYTTFPGLTFEGNRYFQSKGTLNSGLMLYGNTDPTKILIGKSQNTFETAIKSFDANPELVYWVATQK